MRKKASGGLLFLTLTLGYASVANAGEWRYSSGFDYSKGDYGGDPVDTTISYMPFSARYTTGNWKLKGTASWVSIKGAGTVVGAGGGGVVIGHGNRGGGTAATQSGVGDTWLAASYSLESFPVAVGYLDLGAKLKLPTGDEDKGLGTGETDYTLQLDYFKPVGATMPYATLAYKVKGEPAGVTLNNVMYLSLGCDFRRDDDTHVGVSLDSQQAATVGGDDSMELLGYLNQSLNSKWALMLYGYAGLADGSPDYGVGMQLSFQP